jgi:hypothetical protein
MKRVWVLTLVAFRRHEMGRHDHLAAASRCMPRIWAPTPTDGPGPTRGILPSGDSVVVLALCGAYVSDRYGAPSRTAGWGLAVSAIGYVVFGFAHSVWLLFVSRFVQGLGGGTPCRAGYVAGHDCAARACEGIGMALGGHERWGAYSAPASARS